jgi:hypothetical protein
MVFPSRSPISTRGITAEHTKYAYVVGSLQPEVAQEVRDLLINLPAAPYTKLKIELVKRTSASQQKRLNAVRRRVRRTKANSTLPSHATVARRYPTGALHHETIVPPTSPKQCSTADEMDTASLAKMADKIVEVAPLHSTRSTVVSQSAPPPTHSTVHRNT